MAHNTIAIVGEPLLPIRREPRILSKHGPPGPELLELASEELRRSLGPGFPWLKLWPGEGHYRQHPREVVWSAEDSCGIDLAAGIEGGDDRDRHEL